MTCLGCFHTDYPFGLNAYPSFLPELIFKDPYTHTEEDGAPLAYEANELVKLVKITLRLTLL